MMERASNKKNKNKQAIFISFFFPVFFTKESIFSLFPTIYRSIR